MRMAIKSRTKRATLIGAVISILATYGLCLFAVIRKWDLRMESAITPEQMDMSQADGANKIFTAYVSAPIEAIFWTALWGFIWMRLNKKSTKSNSKNLEKSNCCIEFKNRNFDAEVIFWKVSKIFSSKSVFCFEGTSINDEVMKFYKSNAGRVALNIPRGTIWPKSDVFHVPVNKKSIASLRDFFSRLAIPEICDHFIVYEGNRILLEAHDFGNNPLYFHKGIPEGKVERLASELGGAFISFIKPKMQ